MPCFRHPRPRSQLGLPTSMHTSARVPGIPGTKVHVYPRVPGTSTVLGVNTGYPGYTGYPGTRVPRVHRVPGYPGTRLTDMQSIPQNLVVGIPTRVFSPNSRVPGYPVFTRYPGRKLARNTASNELSLWRHASKSNSSPL
eukprot:1644924-Rhodomonas_salina.2